MPCGMYFTLPKDLIKALLCQHLVNIKIIIHAIITFQTLLTCSDLHKAWLSSYTKTLKRRKMVSCSYTTYRRGQVSKKALYQGGSVSSSQEADQDMNQGVGAHLTSAGFCLPRPEGTPPQPVTSSCTYRSSTGCLFRDKNAHYSERMAHRLSRGTSGETLQAVSLSWLLLECAAVLGRTGWAHGEGILGDISSRKRKG